MKVEILETLRNAEGFVSGQELCEKFNVSRTAVWKAINTLKKEGYEFEAVQNKGYRITKVPDLLSENEWYSINKNQWVGKKVKYFENIDSTNVVASHMAEEGAEHGTLVFANQQTMGKGRRGRTWISKPGTGIYMTLILKPDILPNEASMLTLVSALAVVKALEEVAGIEGKIKWPNDVVVNGKKICGILTEMSAQIDYISYIVVGIGINVLGEEIDEEIKNMATSLYLETGKKINRMEFMEKIWEKFEAYYEIFLKTKDMSALEKEYNSYLANCKEKVCVLDPKGKYEGTAQGINSQGELIVDTWEARRLVSSGEVSVRGIYGYV